MHAYAGVGTARHWSGILLLTLLISPVIRAQIAPGDILVIGLHADAPDAFAWVTLVDLAPGEVIFFSDAGWIGGDFSGDATVSDGGLRFVVPAGGLPAGKVSLVPLDGSPLPAGYQRVGGALGPEMLAGSFGDQIAVFTGSTASPTFLFALHTNATAWGTGSPPNHATESELYPGLQAGTSAVAVGAGSNAGDEVDNAVYTGPSRGTPAELRAAVADPDNWSTSNNPIADITNGTLGPGWEIIGGGETEFIRGYVNADAERDLSDAVAVFAFLFLGGAAPACEDAADVNDDGSVDISDGIALLNFLFLGGTAPSPPTTDCGPDPTDDALSCENFPTCP